MIPSILLVKITSMGDLIQMLPAITDAAQNIPGIKFNWVVDESFQAIPKLHPNIDKLIIVPYRRWKKDFVKNFISGEVSQFLRELRSIKYDMVIDAQSNFKSAFITKLARGVKYGLDATSVREYGAHFAYDKTITIDRDQNHATRMRQLMATFLGYNLPKTSANYGISLEALPQLNIKLPENFVFISMFASRKDKQWPEPYWHEVIKNVTALGFNVVISWWTLQEQSYLLDLQKQNNKIYLLPEFGLLEKARVLSNAKAAIGVDTGLSHMAAALNTPNICLYGSTDPRHVGTLGEQQVHLKATGPSCSPCLRTSCNYRKPTTFTPACLATISAADVMREFETLVL